MHGPRTCGAPLSPAPGPWYIWRPGNRREKGPDDLRVIAINEEHESWKSGELERVAACVDKLGPSFSVVADLDLSRFEKDGVSVIPSLVLIDGEGKVIATLASYPEQLRSEFYEQVLRPLGTSPG